MPQQGVVMTCERQYRRLRVSREEGNQIRTSAYVLLTGEQGQAGQLSTVNSPQIVTFDW